MLPTSLVRDLAPFVHPSGMSSSERCTTLIGTSLAEAADLLLARGKAMLRSVFDVLDFLPGPVSGTLASRAKRMV